MGDCRNAADADLLDQLFTGLVVELRPGLRLAVFLYDATTPTHDEIVQAHAADDILKGLQRVRANVVLGRRLVVRASAVISFLLADGETACAAYFPVQRASQVEPRREQPGRQRFRRARQPTETVGLPPMLPLMHRQ